MSNLGNMAIGKIDATQAATRVAAAQFREKLASGEFAFTLKKLQADGLALRLEGLLVDITAWGKRIAEHPDLADLRRYRGLIGEFIREIITHAYEFSRENFLDRRGR
ncbi:MAG: YaaR family protein, partial [Defluviitaleaceae bacterium]|nr:YaaR family protein [Defluviitaleaceae bacterium]